VKRNPFKFGSIVDDPYFVDRIEEIKRISSVLNSENHLIITGPRRFGKSSLVFKAISNLKRTVISVDLQLITSPSDLAAQLLKRIYRVYSTQKLKQFIKQFRVIPTLSVNPVTGGVDLSFQPGSPQLPVIEDVLNLIEKISNPEKKIVVIFDEFQEAAGLDPGLMKQLRSIMQHHRNINYIFLGSQESLIRDIFEKKKSSFYHFGMIMPLGKIPENEFMEFLIEGLKGISKQPETIAKEIISTTTCHPYYTQQLAYVVWDKISQSYGEAEIVRDAVGDLIRMHEMDYERIWNNFNKTDKKLLIGLSSTELSPLSEAFYRQVDIGAPSTAFSSIRRLAANGYITRPGNKYEIDDPFFRIWLKQRRDE